MARRRTVEDLRRFSTLLLDMISHGKKGRSPEGEGSLICARTQQG